MRSIALLTMTALFALASVMPVSAQSTQLGARPMPIARPATSAPETPFTLPSSAPPPAPDVALARHRMHVTMDGGFAVVAEELTLDVARTPQLAHTSYLAVPAMSELVALEACQGGACRDGSAVPEASAVFTAAQRGHRTPGDAPFVLAERDGERIVVRVAGLEAGTATIRVVWSAATERFGGRERLRLPARREAPELTLASATLDALSIDGEAERSELPEGRPFDLIGTVRANAPTLEIARVDETGAGFVRVSAPPVAPRARPIVILFDASPSARRHLEAMEAALAMLLDEAPDGSTATVIAYARRARTIAVGDVASLRRNGVRMPTDLGPSTSLASALSQIDSLPSDATVVWLTDGAAGASAGEAEARDELTRRGVRAQVVDDRDGIRFGAIDPFGDPWSARARLAALFSTPTDIDIGHRLVRVTPGAAILVPLRSAEHVPATAVASTVPAIAARPLVLASLGDSPPRALLTLDPRDRHAANKAGRGRLGVFVAGGGLPGSGRYGRIIVCHCGGYDPAGHASREALRRMMDSLRAPVRACFADARRGDPRYEARATFVLGLRGDELVDSQIETDDPSLHDCLTNALDSLIVPSTDGRSESLTVLRYPFVTRAVDTHEQSTPLDRETASRIDTTFADEPSVPPMSLLAGIGQADSSASR